MGAIAKYEGKIDDRQYPEWGLLEKDCVIRDAWYGYKGDSNDRDENMDIDDNTSNNKKEARVFCNSNICFEDKRYYQSLCPHGVTMNMNHFKDAIFEGPTLSEFCDYRF